MSTTISKYFLLAFFILCNSKFLPAQFLSDLNLNASIGYSIPSGKLSEYSKPEYCWRIDGEYNLPANLAANFGFERSQFINKPDVLSGSRGISKIDNVYLGVKYKIPGAPLNLNVKTAGGLFIYEDGLRQNRTDAGFNIGIEVYETMFRGTGFSAETGYRQIFSENGNLNFFTITGGLRFRLR